MALLPLPGPTVGLATNTNTPTTTYYSWFRSLFDTMKAVVVERAGRAIPGWRRQHGLDGPTRQP